MFPGMVYAILSTDLDFVQDMTETLTKVGGDVYWATSWDEYARIQQDGGGDVRGRSGVSAMLRVQDFRRLPWL
jgi:hypothetical protein